MTTIEYKFQPNPELLNPRKTAVMRPSDAAALRNVILGVITSMSESGAEAKALESAYKMGIKDKYGWIDAKNATTKQIFDELLDWLRREFGILDIHEFAEDAYLRRIASIVKEWENGA